MCYRMCDFLHEYLRLEQLPDANADDEEMPSARQSRVAARLALFDYLKVDEVLRYSPLLPTDIELRLSHTISLWNLAFVYLPK